MHERQAALAALEAEIRHCTRCPLHRSRTNAVPGEGPPDAPVLFIGEAPGANEDRLGRPFVGPAGELLEAMLERVGLIRDDVYITNVVKCRPPGNRDPLPEEIKACKPFLARQVRLVAPEVIVTLGRFAMERWLPNRRITRVHGRAFRFGSRLVVPMFHPAAALRRPEWLPLFQEDFDRLPALVDAVRLWRQQNRVPAGLHVETVEEGKPPAQLNLFGQEE
ncbi:MAG: uracil-DNA glycosylase [Ardenticatenia bacterium]|nr:uracil-DNA glycosylase [Ardenticatenia bacterium]